MYKGEETLTMIQQQIRTSTCLKGYKLIYYELHIRAFHLQKFNLLSAKRLLREEQRTKLKLSERRNS